MKDSTNTNRVRHTKEDEPHGRQDGPLELGDYTKDNVLVLVVMTNCGRGAASKPGKRLLGILRAATPSSSGGSMDTHSLRDNTARRTRTSMRYRQVDEVGQKKARHKGDLQKETNEGRKTRLDRMGL